MGTLIYSGTQEYEFDDRTLEYLRIVITSRLRKDESFLLTWTTSAPRPVTISLWITSSVPIAFHFAGEQQRTLSQEWFRYLMKSSYSTRGLMLAPEQQLPGNTAQE